MDNGLYGQKGFDGASGPLAKLFGVKGLDVDGAIPSFEHKTVGWVVGTAASALAIPAGAAIGLTLGIVGFSAAAACAAMAGIVSASGLLFVGGAGIGMTGGLCGLAGGLYGAFMGLRHAIGIGETKARELAVDSGRVDAEYSMAEKVMARREILEEMLADGSAVSSSLTRKQLEGLPVMDLKEYRARGAARLDDVKGSPVPESGRKP